MREPNARPSGVPPVSIECLTDFFEDSFRALRPEKLGESILSLCRETSWGASSGFAPIPAAFRTEATRD